MKKIFQIVFMILILNVFFAEAQLLPDLELNNQNEQPEGRVGRPLQQLNLPIKRIASSLSWEDANVNGDKDASGNDIVDINDVVAIINHMAGTMAWNKADVNKDYKVDINDVVAVINFMANPPEREKPDMMTITVNGVSFNMIKVEGGTFVMGAGSLPTPNDSVPGSEPTPNDSISEDSVLKPEVVKHSFTVNGVSFNMIFVEGGTFTMGGKDNDESKGRRSNELPSHDVTLSDYMICETEVTQELWMAVMNENPSDPKFRSMQLPVNNVTWEECKEFIKRLTNLTKVAFRLPTEAEWEYAARGGKYSKNFVYAGSNNVDDVAVYDSEDLEYDDMKPAIVASKTPNELGIYDMSGNVWEWCEDYYSDNYYEEAPELNPKGPESPPDPTYLRRVLRGGSWWVDFDECTVSYRNYDDQDDRDWDYGLRLVIDHPENLNPSSNFRLKQLEREKVNGSVNANLEDRRLKLTATNVQDGDADSDEYPAHEVTLSTYYIGQTEVTQELWKAVMGSNPSVFKGGKRPVECVSWDDCQTFIQKLNALTGQKFHLPTEAEWEYAARGGNKSKGYTYSGSNNVRDVAWCGGWSQYNNAGETHPVGMKVQNELGIYDMSGNVDEWCQDWYDSDYYSVSPKINPTGPSYPSDPVHTRHVIRGGCWFGVVWYCRVSSRANPANDQCYYYGLRLAL